MCEGNLDSTGSEKSTRASLVAVAPVWSIRPSRHELVPVDVFWQLSKAVEAQTIPFLRAWGSPEGGRHIYMMRVNTEGCAGWQFRANGELDWRSGYTIEGD